MNAGDVLKAVAGVVFACLLLALAEGAARLLPERRDLLTEITLFLRQDPELLWRQEPNARRTFAGVPVRTDAMGFRGRGRAEKAAGVTRVALLGASPAFGWGVREERTYVRLLEERLGARGTRVEIVNASVLGYSSYQGKLLLPRVLRELRPDVVVFAYGVNDVDKHRFFRSEAVTDRELRPANAAALALQDLLRRSRLARMFSSALRRRVPSGGGRRRVPPADFKANLEQFGTTASEAGARLLLATSPFSPPPDPAKSPELAECAALAAAYNSAIRTFAADTGTPLADIEKAFAGGGTSPQRGLMLDPGKDLVHFSEKGHDMAADVLAGVMGKMIE